MNLNGHEEEARITLTFKDGLADRNRLPIDQVLQTLVEFKELVREIGKRTRTEQGHEAPDGDFGLELVADKAGNGFRKGSIRADFVATKHVAVAKAAFAQIMAGISDAEKGRTRQSSPAEQAFVRHMGRIAAYQRTAKNAVVLQFSGAGDRRQTVRLTTSGYAALEQEQASRLKIEQQILYGKLLSLRDRTKTDSNDGHFWGDLLADSGTVWHLRFPSSLLEAALKLFRQQVFVQGMAIHFEAGSSRMNVLQIELDRERDYVKAFEEIGDTSFFGDATRDELIEELYA